MFGLMSGLNRMIWGANAHNEGSHRSRTSVRSSEETPGDLCKEQAWNARSLSRVDLYCAFTFVTWHLHASMEAMMFSGPAVCGIFGCRVMIVVPDIGLSRHRAHIPALSAGDRGGGFCDAACFRGWLVSQTTSHCGSVLN